jgi:hypothetical protein
VQFFVFLVFLFFFDAKHEFGFSAFAKQVSAAGWAALGDFVAERAAAVDPADAQQLSRAVQQLKKLPRQAIEGLVESHYVDLSLRAGHTR